AAGRIDALANPETDPASGQPELKHTPISLSAFSAKWFGLLAVIEEPDLSNAPISYWAKARIEGGWRVELAGGRDDADIEEIAARLTDLEPNAEILEYADTKTGALRRAAFIDGKLAAVFVGSNRPVAAERAWLAEQIGKPVDSNARLCLLAGRPPVGEGVGRAVCACMGVGATAIETAIRQGANSVEAIGAVTRAGTNCGSCKPEIRDMLNAIAAEQVKEAAE
ncbi:MAG: (2Fe-2S)-binding protein, partial [Pseudomonadota bacterium]